MRALFDSLRHNPDIIAVLVLCLTLGIAKQPIARAWAEPPSELKIHWTCTNPVDATMDAIDEAIASIRYF